MHWTVHGGTRHPFQRKRLREDPQFKLEMSYCVDKGIPHDLWLSWSKESRAKHVAFLLEQSEVCQLCGTAEWEWKENHFAYEPSETLCRGCYLKEVASEEAGKLPGTTVSLTPVTPLMRAEQEVVRRRRSRLMLKDD